MIMVYLWYVRFFAYFGLQFNLDDLGSAIVLNFTTMGIAEIFASLASAPIKRNFERKSSMQLCLLICSLCCLVPSDSAFSFFTAISKLY